MPTQYDMTPESELYRAVLAYDHQPMRREPNPDYKPNNVMPGHYTPSHINVPDGPMEVRERMIGPYQSVAPIKSYITRNRGRSHGQNLRLVRVERASVWEEVQI